MPKINVSFKKTSKDMELYLEIMKKEERSVFVKECIKFWLDSHKNKSNHSRN